ncbi:hypothetical protein [Cellulomonas shaoxiangyii]|uniref:Uncharacterized protein n=1 Tax=Cellulomonas shaoxiangyii TaxID=2566013 RepID=A0A4V1CML0_9CELL|nr:hypothetical protein [Cellulomonas shaoxiangyii]QCB93315.1 hypothetical protein E5225_06885 [Cellulomonas shaoxiangyii]TGY79420.1 hypothetical protein E5226_15415 [Cellulomonas shaoxiangyii]
MTTIRTLTPGVTATVTPDTEPGFVAIEWTGAGSTHREVLHGGDLAEALGSTLTPAQVEALAASSWRHGSGGMDLGDMPHHDQHRRHVGEWVAGAGIEVAR